MHRPPMSSAAPAKQRGTFWQWLAVALVAVVVAGANLVLIHQLTLSRLQVLLLQGLQHPGSSMHMTRLLQGGSADISHLQHHSSSSSLARRVRLHYSSQLKAMPKVFVGVLSAAGNTRSRDVIRQTWGADPLLARVMFFCQRPSSDEAFRKLRQEAAAMQDVFVTSEVLEHYHNITYSVLDLFKVAASMSESFNYVVKTDDDVFVRPALLLHALRSMPRQRLYAGWPMTPGNVMRWGRYHRVPYKNWSSDKSVRYSYGAGYVLSMDLVKQIAAGAPHVIMRPDNLLIMEDIAVGFWVDFLASEQKVDVAYNDTITPGDICTPSTMFYHVTSTPKWAEISCMHQHGGVCCEAQPSCRKCLRDLQLKDLGPTTSEPMMPQPPFAPGCFPSVYNMSQLGCPVLDCSLDSSCTTHNVSCCAYINYQMLDFFDRFLTTHCMQDEYMLVYGSVLGAVRNQTILPHTEDVDIGLTPLAIQFMELNSTKELLWSHGYTFWHHYTRGVWKLCPHAGHPSPRFRAVMTDRFADVEQYENTTGRLMSAFVDVWLMWPVSGETERCSRPWRRPVRHTGPGISQLDTQALLRTPWDSNSNSSSSAVTAADVCRLTQLANQRQNLSRPAPGLGPVQKYCVSESNMPHVMQQGYRTANIDGKLFPMPDNYKRIMAATYGANWMQPDKKYYGISRQLRDEQKVKAALVEKLSVTAWGNVPWQERRRQCKLT